MKKIMIPMAALTLALSVSPALHAQPRDRRAPDRYDDRYDNRGRYDTRWDARRAAALAHDIEQTAYSIRRQAEANNRRPDRREARMLSALRELNQEANQFRAQVEDRRLDNRSRRDFEELVRAYRETSNVVDRNDPRPYIDRGMNRIASLLSELSGYFGRRGDYRYDRDDRDGRGRDGRWDGDHH